MMNRGGGEKRRSERFQRTASYLALLSSSACGTAGPLGGAPTDQRSVAEYDLARDAFQKNRLREALSHVQKALELDGDNSDAAYLGAIVLLAFCANEEESPDCRYGEAETYARKALKANSDMRDARNTLGVILIQQKRYSEAIEVLKPLAADILYTTPEKAWGNLGWAHYLRGATGDNQKAIEALSRAVAAQPLFCVGEYRLGLAYEKSGDLVRARSALSKAVDSNRPECRGMQDAYEARARISKQQGLIDEARADLTRCRDIGASTKVGQRCAAELGGLP